MKRHSFIAMSAVFFAAQITLVNAQNKSEEKLNPIVQNFVNEANNNSQLEDMAFELLDGIGPRLVGTPEMLKSNEWSADKLKSWGIDANLQQFGTWKGWQRGTTHVDMVYPRT
ncbi:MAG: peptidase M28, partial [Chryseobacterium sp.]|nr:peptidase M28 [Chryseobacterium sp.]